MALPGLDLHHVTLLPRFSPKDTLAGLRGPLRSLLHPQLDYALRFWGTWDFNSAWGSRVVNPGITQC